MENVSVLSEVAVPKARINGFNIWDLRHLDRKAGWHVVCQNEEHSFFVEFHRLDDAKDFAKKNAVCLDCVAVKRENERQYEIRKCVRHIEASINYLDNAKFIWLNGSNYSTTAPHGGAKEVTLGFGIEGQRNYDFFGARTSGEVRIELASDGMPVITYAKQIWVDGNREFKTWTDRAEFEAELMSELEPKEEEFTNDVRTSIQSEMDKLFELGLSVDEIHELVARQQELRFSKVGA